MLGEVKEMNLIHANETCAVFIGWAEGTGCQIQKYVYNDGTATQYLITRHGEVLADFNEDI